MNENTFAYRLIARRKELKLTQADIEKLSGIPIHTIRNFEQGVTQIPGADNLLQLADVLDISPYRLLYGGNEMKTNTYTESIVKELLQLGVEQVVEIKKTDANGTMLSRLMLSEEVIDDLCMKWNAQHLFNGHNCYRNYVKDVVIKYCQNRSVFMEKFNLISGLSKMNKIAGIAE